MLQRLEMTEELFNFVIGDALIGSRHQMELVDMLSAAFGERFLIQWDVHLDALSKRCDADLFSRLHGHFSPLSHPSKAKILKSVVMADCAEILQVLERYQHIPLGPPLLLWLLTKSSVQEITANRIFFIFLWPHFEGNPEVYFPAALDLSITNNLLVWTAHIVDRWPATMPRDAHFIERSLEIQNWRMAKYLLATGFIPGPNSLALALAVRARHHELAKALVALGVDVNAQEGEAVAAACDAADEKLLLLLLKHGAQIGRYAGWCYHVPIIVDNVPMFQLLLHYDVPVAKLRSVQNWYEDAAMTTSDQMLDLVIATEAVNEMTGIHAACAMAAHGRMNSLRKIAGKLGPAYMRQHLSPIFASAVHSGHLNMVEELLRDYAKMAAERVPLQSTLVYAMDKERLPMLRYLLEQGFDPHVETQRPLQIASSMDNREAVGLLLEHGACVMPEEDETIILERVILEGRVHVLRTLLDHTPAGLIPESIWHRIYAKNVARVAIASVIQMLQIGLLSEAYHQTAFNLACLHGRADLMHAIIIQSTQAVKRTVDPHYGDGILLLEAARNNHQTSFLYLADHLRVRGRYLEQTLVEWIRRGNTFCANNLLNMDNVDVHWHDEEPLVAAVQGKLMELVNLLLKHGARPTSSIMELARIPDVKDTAILNALLRVYLTRRGGVSE